MTFKCLGTGSSGNCYLVTLDGSNILLDAGIKMEKITKAVNLNDVSFAFISHEHKDHSLSAEKLRFRGVQLLEGKYIYDFVGVNNLRKIPANMKVYTFPVFHGDCKCAGLVIKTDSECILYLTDLTICKYDLSAFRFTSVIVECNYIKDKVMDGDFVRTKENIYRHLSLDGCDLLLSKLNLCDCKEIILIHFSDNFSDPIYMGSYINSKYKLPVKCCRKLGGYDLYE